MEGRIIEVLLYDVQLASEHHHLKNGSSIKDIRGGWSRFLINLLIFFITFNSYSQSTETIEEPPTRRVSTLSFLCILERLSVLYYISC